MHPHCQFHLAPPLGEDGQTPIMFSVGLRDDPLASGTGEPDTAWENEPENGVRNGPDHPSPANDDAAATAETAAAAANMQPRNEPADPATAAPTALQRAVRAELDSLVASGEEEPDPTRLARLTRELCLPQRRAAG